MKVRLLFTAFLMVSAGSALAGDIERSVSDADDSNSLATAPAGAGGVIQLFGSDPLAPSIGGFLFPHLHAFGAFGGTTGHANDLAVGHHDPQQDATLQGVEPGLSLRAGMLEGFATGSGTTDHDGDFSFELEEAFLKLVDLPLGLELRGGQFLNRFGFQAAVHNHSWDFVNQNLVNGRFLTEGELITRGGEVTVPVPLSMMSASFLSVSVGDARVEDHDHEEGEHGHGGEAAFEGEGAYFGDILTGVHWVNQYDINDRNRLSATVSGAFGENLFGRDSQIYGLGFEYLWRENGYSAGGRSLRWRTEAMLRSVDAISGHLPGEEEDEHHDEHGEEDHDEHGEEHHDEHGEEHHDEHGEEHHDEHGEEHHDEHEGEDEHEHEDEAPRYDSFDEFGAYSSLVYGFNDNLEAGLRGEWVSGINDFGLDERWRVSPALTWYANQERTLQVRLQYDYDYSQDFGSESSVWLQVGFNWGSAEVR